MSNKMALDALTDALVTAMEEAIASIDAGMHLGASVTLGEALWKNRAAIAALQAEPQGWQPIETAPRDGTDVIVMYMHIDTQIVHNAFFASEAEGWNPEDVGWWTYTHSEVSRELLNDWRAPTHWMPLPATPPKD